MVDAHWQVQEAKQRFSELLRRTHAEGRQFVTRHGQEVAVVLDIEEYRRLCGHTRDFKAHLLGGPKTDELVIERSDQPAPEIDLSDAH